MKVAISAASGGLGRAIIEEIKNHISTDQIIGIARSIEKAENLGVEIRKGDYNIKVDFLRALHDIDTILIVSGMDKPENRIIQHKNIIDAAKEAGVSKIVYTSIIGAEKGNSFAPIVSSNRQTENDIKNSGLNWVIGRNGPYIEPDIEYINNYIKDGKISNCAADGKCSYTTRNELAYAYTQMILDDKHIGNIYNLVGEAITQTELADYLNSAFKTSLTFQSNSIEVYKNERIVTLGEFLGTVIGGIYEGIRNGKMHVVSDYNKAAGRDHISWEEYFSTLKIPGQKYLH